MNVMRLYFWLRMRLGGKAAMVGRPSQTVRGWEGRVRQHQLRQLQHLHTQARSAQYTMRKLFLK